MTKIQPGHGSGGKLMNDMIQNIIKEKLGKDTIQIDDSAILPIDSSKIAFTTDTFTITPIFFPGGDIGTLAINGTVNDLAVMGAIPKFISCGIILEEGFEISEFEKILDSIKKEADSAGVEIVTGDTKVVPFGKGDKIYINTTGIGIFTNPVQRRDIAIGDKILISGSIGDHGMTIMSKRNNLSFTGDLVSDCGHLNHLIQKVITAFPESIKFMRDPTRGGVGSVLNEIVNDTNLSAGIIEDDLPIKDTVKGISDLLGIDPIYVANEGKVLMIVSPDNADAIVSIMKETDIGKEASIIGEVDEFLPGKAYIKTGIGGNRILPLLIEEQLPRIC
jgi:hydrogenase expression/formation protein HypE